MYNEFGYNGKGSWKVFWRKCGDVVASWEWRNSGVERAKGGSIVWYCGALWDGSPQGYPSTLWDHPFLECAAGPAHKLKGRGDAPPPPILKVPLSLFKGRLWGFLDCLLLGGPFLLLFVFSFCCFFVFAEPCGCATSYSWAKGIETWRN